jgi:hypothetical protein
VPFDECISSLTAGQLSFPSRYLGQASVAVRVRARKKGLDGVALGDVSIGDSLTTARRPGGAADGKTKGRRNMVRKLAVVGGLATLLAAGGAVAGTPFGGDDTGTISSSKTVTACEAKVAKGVSKLVAGILSCHCKEATGKLVGDTAEEPCETAAITKFTSKTKTTGCPACINLSSIATAVAALVDSNNAQAFCDPAGTPLGGDDTGTTASNKVIGKCECGVAKATGKLVAGISTCHTKEGEGKLVGDSAEEPCETTALSKFGTTKTAGCPSCVNLTTIGNFVASTLDGANSLVWCGSPSGAFLN